MTQRLISDSAHAESESRLQNLYQQGLIPAEKKPFLIDANHSSGPFLKVQDGGFICDLASQIASIGLGFNAGALFGCTQYLESWLGQTDTKSTCEIKLAFTELLQRKLGSDKFEATFCSSGAEAIELGLAACFGKFSGQRKRILAFENSFHGRMMVALSCTYNPAKREPFSWPHFDTAFVPYPELLGDDIRVDDIHVDDIDGDSNADMIKVENEILESIESHLSSNEFFAVLIEPIQCEGGDRYSSARFHNRLIALCRKNDVPLIYDEIQSGFGLGGEFFWHRKFDLREENYQAENDETENGEMGQPLFPDVVISAKKAQVGLVLSQLPIDHKPPFNFASLSRGYIQASMLDQFQSEIEQIESDVRERLHGLVKKYSSMISRPRNSGLCFAFDFETKEQSGQFISKRFEHGLLYYPAGTKTARFRVNLSFRKPQIDFAFRKLDYILGQMTGAESNTSTDPIEIPPVEHYLQFNTNLIQAKLGRGEFSSEDFLKTELERIGQGDCKIHFPNSNTFANFRDEIMEIQRRVYEPVRQTPLEEFDRVYQSENQLSIIVTKDEQIIGMAFAAPLKLFPEISGNADNPSVDDPKALYMLDLTVDKNFRGGLGRILKQALTLRAVEFGIHEIHGRNRDQLARGMWAINLSLGSHTTRYLENNYADEEKHRDCFYYRNETQWELPPLNLADAIECPLGPDQLSSEFVRRNMGVMVNKLTHSNFVSGDMVEELPAAFEVFGKELRHGYTASSLSEAVDKIVKVFLIKRKPRAKLLVIRDSFWGNSSMLTRALSGIGTPFFETVFVDLPDVGCENEFIKSVEGFAASDEFIAMFVEPLMTKTMRRVPEELLAKTIAACHQNHLPVIFNESAGQFYRFSQDAFSASNLNSLNSDGVVSFLGGQMALVGVTNEYFVDDPLMLISTWDGDAYSLARFVAAKQDFESDLPTRFKNVEEFEKLLKQELSSKQTEFEIENGVGSISCSESPDGSKRQIICPSYWQVEQYLEAQNNQPKS